MKLVCGAGVIGSCLVHVLCAAGNGVTLPAGMPPWETLHRTWDAGELS